MKLRKARCLSVSGRFHLPRKTVSFSATLNQNANSEASVTAATQHFVEKRLSEERFTLAMLQFMTRPNSTSDIGLPDALQ